MSLSLGYTRIEGTLKIKEMKIYITVKPLFQTMVFPRHRDHRLRYESNPRTTRAHFTGSIPPQIGALAALKFLNLQETNVEGASGLLSKSVRPAHITHAGW